MDMESLLDIRKANSADVQLISAISTVTFYEAYFEQDTPVDMARYLAEAFSEEQIAEELADGKNVFFIALREGKAVGYAKLISGSTTEGVSGKNPIELKRIYLVERYWGTGIGEWLLRHCEVYGRERGHDSIWLGVWQENARGQNFYKKHGFGKVGTVTFPYGDTVGINDVMEKAL